MKRNALILIALAGCRSESISVTPISVPAVDRVSGSADAGLVVGGSGEVLLSWIGGDSSDYTLYVARSADSGRSWSPGQRVAGGPGTSGEVHPHGESSPRLVAGPGSQVAITWANSIRVPSRKWPAAMMRFSRSTDGGKSWSSPITLNDDTTGALVGHQFHGAAWSGDSGIDVAWLDERGTHAVGDAEPDATIYLASSPDFGRTWSANRRLWGAACPCCRVALARGADGRVLAAWRKHYPGDVRDVVVAPLDANDQAVRRVHDDEWVYPGCPHTGPAVAVASSGAHVVWYTGKKGQAGVYYARAGGAAGSGAVPLLQRPSLPPAHIAVAALPDGGAIAAYDLDGGGKRTITVAWLGPDGSVRTQTKVARSESGTYPQLATLGQSSALLAWTESDDAGSKVRVARVDLPRDQVASVRHSITAPV